MTYPEEEETMRQRKHGERMRGKKGRKGKTGKTDASRLARVIQACMTAESGEETLLAQD
jgi:hypothetical protein